MSDYRTKSIRVQAALYDGKLVGQGTQVGRDAVWQVIPLTCPAWFPAVVQQVDEEPTVVEPGAVVSFGDDLFIGSGGEVLRASPGNWIVMVDRTVSVVSAAEFAARYERA